jgi:hypothetical protein
VAERSKVDLDGRFIRGIGGLGSLGCCLLDRGVGGDFGRLCLSALGHEIRRDHVDGNDGVGLVFAFCRIGDFEKSVVGWWPARCFYPRVSVVFRLFA